MYVLAFVAWMILCGVSACTTDQNIAITQDRMEIESKVLIDFFSPVLLQDSNTLVFIKASKPVEDKIISDFGTKYRIKRLSDSVAYRYDFHDRTTGESGAVCVITDVKISGDYAEVGASMLTEGFSYKLKKENGEWVITSHEPTWIT